MSSPSGRNAYVIVCGNEKGGSGKTTTAMHIITYLMARGHTVASIDLDLRQLSLTRYIENRRRWMASAGNVVSMPDHAHLDRANHDSTFKNETVELERFAKLVQEVEDRVDFMVIDTPGHDSYLMRLAHSMADTLVTPLNDSYVDFDVLGRVDPVTGQVTDVSHYAQMVRDARRHRHSVDNALLDWIVVRNRLSHLTSRNQSRMTESLKNLSSQLGCRLADGISERVIFRELFPRGLTVLDDIDPEQFGSQLTLSHMAGRQEVRTLVETLRLPIDEVSKRRAQTRRNWLNTPPQQVGKLSIFAD